jgi:EAL domain-containing protein (putative c-di-GMP-specific phosphodiesterase class I)
VETQAEMDILGRLQPDLIQGYLFGRPMSAEDARRKILEQDGVQLALEPVPRSA